MLRVKWSRVEIDLKRLAIMAMALVVVIPVASAAGWYERGHRWRGVRSAASLKPDLANSRALRIGWMMRCLRHWFGRGRIRWYRISEPCWSGVRESEGERHALQSSTYHFSINGRMAAQGDKDFTV
jgi:hypothetical protein